MHRVARRLLFLLAVVLGGCGESRVATGPPPAGPAPPGRWYAGDFHVHTSVASNDTRYPDGSLRSFPETIRAVALDRGLSFVVLTDHSNSAGSIVDSTVEDGRRWNQGPEFPLWETAAGLSTPDFLMIDGSELSPVSTLPPDQCEHCPSTGSGRLTPVGHVGCVPIDLVSFDRDGAFVDRPPGEVPGGSGVDQCHERGGFAIVNHPLYRVTPWLSYDWTNYAYDALEVWNGSAAYTTFDRVAYDAYLCDRLAGRAVVAVGGSDNHRTPLPYNDPVSLDLGAPLGLPLTSVFSEALEWDAIMQALRAGRIVIHERGTFVEFRLLAADGSVLGGIGDRIAGVPDGTSLWLQGRSPRPQTLEVRHAAPGACEDLRQPGRDIAPRVTQTVVASRSVCADGGCDFEVTVPVDLAPGLYFATVGEFATQALNIRDVAVTNVLTVGLP